LAASVKEIIVFRYGIPEGPFCHPASCEIHCQGNRCNPCSWHRGPFYSVTSRGFPRVSATIKFLEGLSIVSGALRKSSAGISGCLGSTRQSLPQWRERLFFLNGDVQLYLVMVIHQYGVFDGKSQRVYPGSVEGEQAKIICDSEVLLKVRFHLDSFHRQPTCNGDYLAYNKYIILPILRHAIACLKHKEGRTET